MTRWFGRTGGVGIVAVSGLLAVGCGSVSPVVTAGERAAPMNGLELATSAAGPLVVTCQPGERAVVRQTLLNGQPVALAECLAMAPSPYATAVSGDVYDPMGDRSMLVPV